MQAQITINLWQGGMINWLQGPGGYSADVQVIRETHLAADRYWFDSALEMLILNFLVWSEKHVVCSDVDWNEHPQFNAANDSY